MEIGRQSWPCSWREERWRLVHEPTTGRSWLYDRRADPGELHDVAAEHPDEVARLRGRLDRQAEQDRWLRARLAAAPGRLELDPSARRDLRALGYAGDEAVEEPPRRSAEPSTAAPTPGPR